MAIAVEGATIGPEVQAYVWMGRGDGDVGSEDGIDILIALSGLYGIDEY